MPKNMTNIAELLKDAPKGMKLYSSLFGEVTFVKIDKQSDYPICVTDYKGNGKSFTEFGVYFADHLDAECLLFPSKDRRTWEGWKLPVKPKFKVGDWVVSTRNPSLTYRILESNVTNELGKLDYKVEIYSNGVYERTCFITSNKMDEWGRLWTIEDAKDGDVLVSGSDNPFIYNGNIEFSFAGAYVGVSRDERIRLDMFPSKAWTSIKDVKPATKEQRDLLFKKIKEIGYEWDYEKKELRNIINPKFKVGDNIKTGNQIETIAEVGYATRSYYCESGRTIYFANQDLWHLVLKPHYDINNFHAGMPVLVREYDTCHWQWVQYSHFNGVGLFFAAGKTWRQCIPFNDDTKHLLGTTNMPDEYYINW